MLLTASSELTNLGTMWTQFVTWMTELVTFITTHPVCMLGIALFAVGGVIGLAYRIIKG